MNTNPLWFMNSLVTVRVSQAEGQDGVSILEHRVPFGDSPPMHVHVGEDEIFHILEGEFRMRIGDQEQRVGPGTIQLAPKGIAHTYRVESPEGGRFLTITIRGDFERFVRALGRPALVAELPDPGDAPTPEEVDMFTAAAAQHGIDIVGPPLQ